MSKRLVQIDVDNAFNEFQQTRLATFSTKFDTWLVEADVALTVRYGTIGEVGTVDTDAIRRQVDVVYDLAQLCRELITGDLWAWAFLHLRRGASVDDAVRAATARHVQTQTETYD